MGHPLAVFVVLHCVAPQDCTAINLCAMDKGGCGSNSQCVYDGPGQRYCVCMSGFKSPTNNGTACKVCGVVVCVRACVCVCACVKHLAF